MFIQQDQIKIFNHQTVYLYIYLKHENEKQNINLYKSSITMSYLRSPIFFQYVSKRKEFK